MKLRNKLVAVMAASMVVTSVPVVTMADSDNTLSVYNYSIKDSTIGFTTSSYVYNTTTKATVAYTNGGVFDAYNSNLPKLEITPEYNYSLNGTQSAFLHLTKDSEFKEEAYLAYVDALNNGGQSQLYIDSNGLVQNAVTAAWNGQKPSKLITDGELKFSFDADGTPVAYVGGDTPSVTVKPMEITESTINDRKYKSSLRLDFTGKFSKKTTYPIAFLAKVGGDEEVLAYLDGRDSFVTTKTFTITGKLSDKKLVATSEDDKKITVDNIEEIGEIRLDENQIGSLKNADNRWIKIELSSSADLQFNLSKTRKEIKAVGKRGFFGKEESITNVVYGKETRTRNSDGDENNQVLLVELPKWEDSSAKGQVVLKGIYVEPQDKTAVKGDVKVTVKEDLTHGTGDTKDNHKSTDLIDTTTLKVGEVTEYDLVIESTPIDVKAGRSGVIGDKRATFSLKEAVKDSLVDSRKIEFTLDNGYIFGPADVDYSDKTYSTSNYNDAAKARFKKLVEDETIKFEEDAEIKEKDGKLESGFDESSLSLNIDANGYVIGFSARYEGLSDKEDDEIKVTLPVATQLQSTGEIKVKASNVSTRTFDKDVEGVIAKIISPINVEVENAAIKVGLQDQKAGKVTIKETDKGMFERGWLYLSAEDFQDGITFESTPTVKVTSGNLEVKNVQIDRSNKVVAIEVTKTSTEASTIEVSDINFTADRTVPEANYDLQIFGPALTDENKLDVINLNNSANVFNYTNGRGQYSDMYVVKDFITMTTKNTQDIDASGLKAATASFVIGENSFTVNGEKVSMDSAAYIKDNYTMVPVKYVAKAFGIEGNAVQYDQATHTATIVAGNKVISITAGKAVMTVNGTPVPMATKAEVKDGRMCVPMAYIASALDVQKNWDASTKTATFTNQADDAKTATK